MMSVSITQEAPLIQSLFSVKLSSIKPDANLLKPVLLALNSERAQAAEHEWKKIEPANPEALCMMTRFPKAVTEAISGYIEENSLSSSE